MGSIDLSCPAAYNVLSASCNGEASNVIHGQTPSPPTGFYSNYLVPNVDNATGVHCDFRSAVLGQAIVRCAKLQ
jgi:hypothetical protein